MATEECSSSTSAANSTEKQEIMKKASELLAQGKRNVVCGEVPKAISLFDEAVQLLAKEYGELSRNCVDAYFSYGSALLELGRMETNVLGVALEGVDVDAKDDEAESDQFEKPPAEDGEEREKLRNEVYDAMAEGERDMEVAKDSKCEEGNTEDKKAIDPDSGEMDTDIVEEDAKNDSKKGTNEKDNMDIDLEMDKGAETSTKEVDGKDNMDTDVEMGKETETDASSIDHGDNGRSYEPVKAKMEEDKTEKEEEPKEVESKVEKENIEGSEVKENEENGDKKQSLTKDDVKENEESESRPVENVSKDEELKPKESPAKVLAEVNQVKSEDEPSSKEINKEPLSAEEKENLPSDKEACPENKDKECKEADKADADVEMTENDKEGEDEESPQGEEQEEQGEEGEEEEEEEQGEGENQEEADGQEDGGEKDEDVPNFQLAWEYLDLAKVIFLKSDSKEDQLKAAECHIKLGEVSMETEQHSTAAEDLESALKIQKNYLAPEDRVIAETHYQLGLAYGLGKEFESSIQHYQQAISVIEAKIASLNKLVEENDVNTESKENCETGDIQKYKDEIKELQELIPEMTNKIEDTKSEAKDLEKMKEMAKEMLGLSGTTKGFGSPKKTEMGSAGNNVDENGEKKASDISSLVRKKRKPEDEAPIEGGAEVKKIKQDDEATVTSSLSEDTKEMEEAKVNGSAEEKVNGAAEVKASGDAADAEMVAAS